MNRQKLKARYWLIRVMIEKYTTRPLACLFKGHKAYESPRLEGMCIRCGHGYEYLVRDIIGSIKWIRPYDRHDGSIMDMLRMKRKR